jgi:hypothetical protein
MGRLVLVSLVCLGMTGCVYYPYAYDEFYPSTGYYSYYNYYPYGGYYNPYWYYYPNVQLYFSNSRHFHSHHGPGRIRR